MRWPPLLSIFAAAIGLSLSACQPSNSGYTGPKECFVDAPCDTDPSQTCQVPCKPNVSGGVGAGHGGSGGSGGASSGGSGGGGPVDVTGKTVIFTTTSFDQTTDYDGPVHVITAGVDTQTVETDTVNGLFSLANAASGGHWVLAQSSGATDAPFSTYSYQDLDGMNQLALPLVPVTVLDDVAVQLTVQDFGADRAQLIVLVSDELGQPLAGASMGSLSGATIGYETSGGVYSLSPEETTDLGIAVALNVSVASESTVDIPFTWNGDVKKFAFRLAPGSVTFAAVAIPTN